jgi:hypothetical protein
MSDPEISFEYHGHHVDVVLNDTHEPEVFEAFIDGHHLATASRKYVISSANRATVVRAAKRQIDARRAK